MADVATLNCEVREKAGTAESRRIRKRGMVPANLYGHQEAAVMISVDHDSIKSMVYSGVHVFELSGAATDLAMMREIQWDTFGTKLLHVDLLRVDRNEKVELDVPVEVKGTAPGVLAGGLLETPHHLLKVECAAYMIPSTIQVRVSELQVGDAIHVSDLEMPTGVVCLNDPGDVVVQIVAAKEVSDDDLQTQDEGGAQPKLVGGEDEEE